MKCINNCFVFNKDEIACPIDAMVYMSMEWIKILSKPSIVDKVKADENVKAQCIRMCKKVQEITKILMEVQKEGAWPKDSHFSPPFDLDFSAHICRITPDQLFDNFAHNASKVAEKGMET